MKRFGRIFLVLAACVMMLLTTACKKDNTPFTHGSIIGKTYSSNFLGIKATVASDWTLMTDTDIAKLNKLKDMSAASTQTIFDKGAYIYEMYANKSDGSSINIVVQDNNKSISFSEKQYFASAKDLVESTFKGMGYDCTASEGKVNFLGKDTRCLEVTMSNKSMTVYEIQIPIFKSHYTATITFGSTKKGDLQSIVKMFTAA